MKNDLTEGAYSIPSLIEYHQHLASQYEQWAGEMIQLTADPSIIRMLKKSSRLNSTTAGILSSLELYDPDTQEIVPALGEHDD